MIRWLIPGPSDLEFLEMTIHESIRSELIGKLVRERKKLSFAIYILSALILIFIFMAIVMGFENYFAVVFIVALGLYVAMRYELIDFKVKVLMYIDNLDGTMNS